MELSSSDIKELLIFSQKKAFLIFSQKIAFLIFPKIKPCTFQPKLEKYKIIHPEKISCTSGNRNPEKNFLYFFESQA